MKGVFLMTTKDKVLALLINDYPQAISGEHIATQLNLSRTSIWKAIQELKKEGHHIISTPNVGYQYVPNNTLSAAAISHFLSPDLKKAIQIELKEEVASTNQLLKQQADSINADHYLLIANNQTKTRGRFGREYFASDKGNGIYFSLMLHPHCELDYIPQYTIITAVALVKAIQDLTDKHPNIKWVNDIYLNEKKIAGILSEAITNIETQTISTIIIGVGINFSIPQQEFPVDLQEKATSLFSKEAPTISRNELIARFLTHFYDCLNHLDTYPFMDIYRQHSFVLGRLVSFTQNQKKYQGKAIQITDKGELVVELADQSQKILSSGEISLQSY